ncbi:hypothetical protein INR49_001138 [Caranx melampygus]|nr:hypothetical protein INR49_001138 [Caranx melampygus]
MGKKVQVGQEVTEVTEVILDEYHQAMLDRRERPQSKYDVGQWTPSLTERALPASTVKQRPSITTAELDLRGLSWTFLDFGAMEADSSHPRTSEKTEPKRRHHH